MEKRTPHCELAIVRRLIAEGKVRATFIAGRSAKQLGFDFDGMVGVVLALTPRDFYKSMTTYVDSKVWQDVYHPAIKSGDVYLKLTVVDDVSSSRSRSYNHEMPPVRRCRVDSRYA